MPSETSFDKFTELPELNNIEKHIGQMLQNFANEDGSFKNKMGGTSGSYSTIEALIPLLLYPDKGKYRKDIIKGVTYVLTEAEKNQKRISPAPEYINIYENCCVDSMAYGLYMLTLARNYLENNPEKDLNEKTSNQIKECIKYISANQNDDKGWSLQKRNGLKSRTYTTALVLLAICNCETKDFENEVGAYKRELLLGNAKDFLIQNNFHTETIKKKKNQNFKNEIKEETKTKWYFAKPSDDDTADKKNDKQRDSVNLTATVVFALSHLLRTCESDDHWEPEVKTKIQEGINYIVDYKIEALKEKDIEQVEYYSEDGQKLSHKYEHPFEMIVPAIVMSPGNSLKECSFKKIKSKIQNEINAIISKKGEKELWQFSDKIFALEYYVCIDRGIEGMLNNFSKGKTICTYPTHKECPILTNLDVSLRGKTAESSISEIKWLSFVVISLGFISNGAMVLWHYKLSYDLIKPIFRSIYFWFPVFLIQQIFFIYCFVTISKKQKNSNSHFISWEKLYYACLLSYQGTLLIVLYLNYKNIFINFPPELLQIITIGAPVLFTILLRNLVK